MYFSPKKIFLYLLVTYGLFGFILLPYILKSKLPQLVAQELNVTLEIESLHFNPFLFKFRALGVKLKDTQERDLFYFESLFVDIELYSIFRKAVHIGELTLVNPKIFIIRDSDGSFNIAKILRPKEQNDEKSDEVNLPRIIVDRVSLRGGSIEYKEHTDTEPFEFSSHSIRVDLSDVDSDESDGLEAKFGFYAALDDGGFLDFKSQISSLESFEIEGSLEFQASRLFNKWQYIRESVNFEVADGKISANTDFVFALEDRDSSHLKNLSIAIERLRLKPKDSAGDILNIKELSLNNAKIYPFKKDIDIESIVMRETKVSTKRSEAGVIDWSEYLTFVPDEVSVQPSEDPYKEDKNSTKKESFWRASLQKLLLEGVSLAFEDSMSKPELTVGVGELDIETKKIDFQEHEAGVDVEFAGASLVIKEFYLQEKEREAQHYKNLLGFSMLSISDIALQSAKQDIKLGSMNLQGFEVHLQKESDGSLNIVNLIESQVQSEHLAESQKQEETYSVMLEELVLSDALVSLIDNSLREPMEHRLESIAVNLYDISLKEGAWLRYDTSMVVGSGGTLSAGGRVRLSPLKQEGSFELKELFLPAFNPYLQESTYINIDDGLLSVHAKTEYKRIGDAADLRVEGSLLGESLLASDSLESKKLFALSNANIDSFMFELHPKSLLINELTLDGFFVETWLDKNASLNFSKLFKTQEKQELDNSSRETQESQLAYKIAKLNLAQGGIRFSDYSIIENFSTELDQIEGSVYALSSDAQETSYIDIAAVIDRYASAQLRGSVDSANPALYTDLLFSLRNINLNSLSAYSLAFTGHAIESGRLDLDLGYDIKDGALLGSNSVTIKKIDLGERTQDREVRVLPMRLAIGLLRDSNDIVSLNVPVKGDLNNPNFRYGALVLKTFTNLMARAVTSPFRFLSDAMGLGADEIEYVAFEPASSKIAPPEREKLSKIAEILKRKPNIILDIAGQFEREKDMQALQMSKFNALVMSRGGIESRRELEGAMSIALLEEIYENSSSREALKSLQEQYKVGASERSIYESSYKNELIRHSWSAQPVEEDELLDLANSRAESIVNYLVGEKMIDEKRIIIMSPKEIAKTKEKTLKLQLEIELK